jgi:AhpD family alkylhydroperoxidase
MTTSAGQPDSVVPFIDEADVAAVLRPAWQTDVRRWGEVRNLTRVVATSRPTWQAVTRAEHMYATMTRLDAATQSLLCLYTSLLNGCDYCIDDAAGAALAEGLSAGQLLGVATPSVPLYGERVTAALRYTFWVATHPTDVPAVVTEELRRYADDEELLEITAVVAMKCFWNRFVSALRIPAEGRCADPELLQALNDLSMRLRRNDRA